MSVFCNQCGTELSDGAMFCTECGNKISPPSAPIPPAPIPEEPAVLTPAEEAPSYQPEDSADTPVAEETAPQASPPPQPETEVAPPPAPQQYTPPAPQQQYAPPPPQPQYTPPPQPTYTPRPQYSQPQYSQPAPQPVEEKVPKGGKYGVLGTFTYFGMMLLFALPILGFIICIIVMSSAKNLNLKNFARANFIWVLLGIILTVACIVGIIVIGKELVDMIVSEIGSSWNEISGSLK